MNKLSENQLMRLNNINMLLGGISLLGGIAGAVYSTRTGGGFWRGAGFFILGNLAVGVPASLIAMPFQNKIIKETAVAKTV